MAPASKIRMCQEAWCALRVRAIYRAATCLALFISWWSDSSISASPKWTARSFSQMSASYSHLRVTGSWISRQIPAPSSSYPGRQGSDASSEFVFGLPLSFQFGKELWLESYTAQYSHAPGTRRAGVKILILSLAHKSPSSAGTPPEETLLWKLLIKKSEFK